MGDIACLVRDGSGTIVGLGQRCGTPTGKCGKETSCKLLETSVSKSMLDGMSPESFVSMWNDEKGRLKLMELGFYEEDVK